MVTPDCINDVLDEFSPLNFLVRVDVNILE